MSTDQGANPMESEPRTPPPETVDAGSAKVGRRALLAGAGLLAATAGGRWLWDAHEGFRSARVAVLKADDYDARLEDVIRRGLGQLGIGPVESRSKHQADRTPRVCREIDDPLVPNRRPVTQSFLQQSNRATLASRLEGHLYRSRSRVRGTV